VRSEIEDKQLAYLYSSIGDIQSTVRAVDTKLGLLMVFLALPVTSLGTIYEVLITLLKIHDSYVWKTSVIVYLIIFFGVWAVSFLTAFKALTSIHNPAAHIKSLPDACGTYFCGGLFKFSFKDIVLNRKRIKSRDSFQEIFERQPNDFEKLQTELVFEQMKLAYIRDIKIFRQNWAFAFALKWLLLGFIGQTIYLFCK